MGWISKTLVLCFFVTVAFSCDREATCAEAAESRRDDYCNIIIDDFSDNEYRFYLKGRNPETCRVNTFRRINYLWGYRFVDKIAKGDTVVKKKGELKFYIHKKGNILSFPFKCGGETFN